MLNALKSLDLGDMLRVSAIVFIVVVVLLGTWLTERWLSKAARNGKLR